ncbi:MAG: type II toxin-antitoxin system PemK/MazF family toxin [Jatrophihabitantaceae bacterium]
MRPIHVAKLDKSRPALVLTREQVRARRTLVTVAPITSTARGLSVEVPVGVANGLDHTCVVNLDNIMTISVADLGGQIGRLLPEQEAALSRAINAAFDLD